MKKLLVAVLVAAVLIVIVYDINITLFEDLSMIVRFSPRFW